MRKSTIITDEEIKKAIKILEKSSVKPRLGVIGWKATGWYRPSFTEALLAKIRLWLKK